MHTIFALCYRPGPAWLPGKPVYEQPLKQHRAYMRSLHDAGTIVLGAHIQTTPAASLPSRQTRARQRSRSLRAIPQSEMGSCWPASVPG
jgi:hypothetical protein